VIDPAQHWLPHAMKIYTRKDGRPEFRRPTKHLRQAYPQAYQELSIRALKPAPSGKDWWAHSKEMIDHVRLLFAFYKLRPGDFSLAFCLAKDFRQKFRYFRHCFKEKTWSAIAWQ
jgi:hypothetical protein